MFETPYRHLSRRRNFGCDPSEAAFVALDPLPLLPAVATIGHGERLRKCSAPVRAHALIRSETDVSLDFRLVPARALAGIVESG